jgi:hypothetical protein
MLVAIVDVHQNQVYGILKIVCGDARFLHPRRQPLKSGARVSCAPDWGLYQLCSCSSLTASSHAGPSGSVSAMI